MSSKSYENKTNKGKENEGGERIREILFRSWHLSRDLSER